MTAASASPVTIPGVGQPARRASLLRSAVRVPRTRVGLALSAIVVLIALVGPFLAPHSPTGFVDLAFSPPSGDAPFGADNLGRDVLSRFLHGGRTLLALSVIATLLGVGVGTVLGVVAGYRRGWRDEFVMRISDIVLAFPQVVAALLCLSIVGPQMWLLVVVVGVSHAPRSARIIRDATLAVVERDFVQAAEATGVRRWRIMVGEILPNITGPLMVELGLRLTYSIGLVAALSFLGLGLQPPTADWGLMINENRVAMTVQPWAVVLPVVAIAVLTIGTNLVTDGLARASAGLDRGGAVKTPPIWTPTKVITVAGAHASGNGRPVAASVQGLRVIGVGFSAARGASASEPRSRKQRYEGAAIVDGNDLDVRPGEIVGLVGESGSGKTTLGLALLAYYKRGTRFAGGHVVVGGRDISALPPEEVRRLRGRSVAYIPQSPASALNPALRIRTQLRECLPDGGVDGQTAGERIREVLREVALPESAEFLGRYPHQLSGGQQQRVAIAMAFIGRPDLIVLDEPTTGLDVTTQKHVLETVRRMCATYSCAAVYISHDMAVVAGLADRIAVMYSGRTVESGPSEAVLRTPRHPYTTQLLMAVPDLEGRREMRGIPGQAPAPASRPHGCPFAPRCPLVVSRCREEAPPAESVKPGHLVRCFRAGVEPLRVVARTEVLVPPAATVLEVRDLAVRYGTRRVLRGIDLAVPRGHCVALLGESGSGKTTLSRCISGLHPHYEGEIQLDGVPLPHSSFQRTIEQRRRVQYVFQNPYESLNPRKTVRDLVLGPARVLLGHIADPDRTVSAALAQASLRADLADCYPDQLSGGERQRVAIARALAAGPDVVICDEVTSALDVSVQSAIVELLGRLQREMGLTLLFVTHDIALVRNVAQSVAVLERGKIVEHGPVASVFDDPQHPYTRALMADTPNFRLVDEVTL